MPLTRAGIKQVNAAIDELFDRAKVRLLGPQSVDKKIAIGYRHELSLPGLVESAAGDEGVKPDEGTLEGVLAIAEGYLDSEREKTKAQVVKQINDMLNTAASAGVELDPETVLGGKVSETWGKIKSNVYRIIDSEAQNGRAMGALEGIVKINAENGIDDPTVFFVIVRDGEVCEECMRLHMLKDRTTPRVWKLSELGQGYHKKGEPNPKVQGLHPHCRCQMTTLMPGYGFDAGGFVKFIDVNHDEYQKQHGTKKSERPWSFRKMG